MKARFLQALLGLVVVAGFGLLGETERGLQGPAIPGSSWATEESTGPPPLVVDAEAPLLLEEPTEPSVPPTPRAAAENAPCWVCHANFREEPLAVQHAAGDVACVDCHGPSYAHRNDENNTTPPEVMYPADRIDPACQKCHATHDVPARQVIARWLQINPNKTDPQAIVCTDCHGRHRLRHRSVRWDPRTGRLLPPERSEAVPPES